MSDVQPTTQDPGPDAGGFEDAEAFVDQSQADALENEGGDDEQPDREAQRRHDEAESRKIALKRERARARAAESRADELAARLARLEASQTRAQPQEDAFAKLQAAKDPLSELDALRQIAMGMATSQQEQDRQAQVQRQEQARIQTLATAMQEYEADFRLEKPDYDKAAEHFRTSLREELEAQGYEGAELNQKFQSELLGLVSRATKASKDPAETVYQLAVKRGYGVDTGKKKLDTIKAGLAAGSSVGRGAATPPRGPISVESVAKKSGAEFMKDFAQLRRQMTRQTAR